MWSLIGGLRDTEKRIGGEWEGRVWVSIIFPRVLVLAQYVENANHLFNAHNSKYEVYFNCLLITKS